MNKAYTPRSEYDCDSSTTHYQGCKCHEARHMAEIERLRKALHTIPEELLMLAKHHLAARGNLSQCQQESSHDAILAASSWIEAFVIKPALSARGEE